MIVRKRFTQYFHALESREKVSHYTSLVGRLNLQDTHKRVEAAEQALVLTEYLGLLSIFQAYAVIAAWLTPLPAVDMDLEPAIEAIILEATDILRVLHGLEYGFTSELHVSAAVVAFVSSAENQKHLQTPMERIINEKKRNHLFLSGSLLSNLERTIHDVAG